MDAAKDCFSVKHKAHEDTEIKRYAEYHCELCAFVRAVNLYTFILRVRNSFRL
jgi:hypothetical protein